MVLIGVMRCNYPMEKKHPNLIKIGKRIRELRKKRGYSQEDFAAAAQLGRSYAGRVERGEQNISIQSLIQIALTLEVEVGEIFPSLKELHIPYRKRLTGSKEGLSDS